MRSRAKSPKSAAWKRQFVAAGIAALALSSLEQPVHAHGSLPISQSILWRGDELLVPAAYWGVFIGTEAAGGGPASWRWICEEAINTNQAGRQLALLSDGTIYATDRTGITVSRDRGCTWEVSAPGSELAGLQVVSLVADPNRARAWALANNNDGTGNGLWYSDDAGRTWQRAYALSAYLLEGLRISADGKTLVIASVTNQNPRQPVLHVSSDGGTVFLTRTISYELDGSPLVYFKPTWIDPRVAGRIYIQAQTADASVLLRIDGTAAPVEAMRTPGVVTAMSYNLGSDQLLVATTKGLYASKGGAAFTALGTFGSTQCMSEHNGSLYACAWNYAPDLAAIAHLNGDASDYKKVFQFNDTQGPVDCPASTPVAQICPMVWATYADQLGVQLSPMPPTDMTGQNGGCSLTASSRQASSGAFGFLAGLIGTLLALRLPRRRSKQLLLRG